MPHPRYDPDRLYRLMPVVIQERDAAEGHPLRALLRLVAEQAEILQTDVQQLWNNFFIETCERWVIPYIGDLVSNNLLHDASRTLLQDGARDLFPDLVGPDLRPAPLVRLRADVAKTIYYRRRKGTLPMLEELARDVTGWPAHAVEFFRILGLNQHLNHLCLDRPGSPDLRRVEAVDRLNGPFDAISHTVDVRAIQQDEGWYNIKIVGFFLWRLRSYPAENVRARQAGRPWQYYASPLGQPAPLFSRWRREGDEAGLATELHVAGPLRPAAFYEDLQRQETVHLPHPDHSNFYGLFEPFPGSTLVPGPECSLAIIRDGQPVPPAKVRCLDLATWSQPTGEVVGVDVRRGRLAFGDAWTPAQGVEVYYHYGFSADLGGGPYERGRWLVSPHLAALRLTVRENGVPPEAYPTLGAALAEWAAQGRPDTVITIQDNRTYAEPLSIELADHNWLVLEAANTRRPHLLPDGGEIQIVGDHPGAELTLNGLLIEGALQVSGEMGRLRLLHTTLVPGRSLDEEGEPRSPAPSLVVAGTSATGATINARLRVEIAFSITGPLRLPEDAEGLWLLDSIVDGLRGSAIAATDSRDQPGPPATLERVTVFGRAYVKRLPLASEVIFTAPVLATYCQDGCVRFSFVPRDSRTPRRYHCQPDLEVARHPALEPEIVGWLAPSFTSERYGQPGYAQLRLGCPLQIRTGAEDGSEMGAFCHLKQTQREKNLRLRLDEYLPFGLDPGFIYVT